MVNSNKPYKLKSMRSVFSIQITILTVVLAVFTYLYGLDSRFAPKNGDEYPYMHIVRMTAQSNHWLPLQSEMDGIKNTKPPLLFWQGIASTGWAKDWSLEALRWPSVVYTGLCAFLLSLTVGRFSGDVKKGMLAALVWLSFFSTYRYGRPFLADPAEVFWLNLPFLGLLYWKSSAFESKWIFPICASIAIGFALLSKSFAYVLPASFALGLWYWGWRKWNVIDSVRCDALKLVGIGILSLAVFALWFILDPDPTGVWREFVLGENAGKFDARSSSYLLDLLWGGDSIWMLLVTSLANAGLFTFVLISALVQSWRQRHSADLEEKLLWLLVLAFFLVFSLPSQRSGRYLLPVMPALATVIALHWDRLPLWGFRIALGLQLGALLVVSWLGWNLQAFAWGSSAIFNGFGELTSRISNWSYPFWHWLILGATIFTVFMALFNKAFAKLGALLGCFLCYCVLTSSIAPLEGALGRYDEATIKKVAGQEIWIPCDYRAKDEEYRLLLPGALLHGYLAKDAYDVKELTNNYHLVAVHVPQGKEIELCEGCRLIGQRVEMRARQTDEEMKEILRGRIGEFLFVNEYLISSPVGKVAADGERAPSSRDACR